ATLTATQSHHYVTLPPLPKFILFPYTTLFRSFVGFSRTYCSASSWNVRARSLASPHACSALPRASPHFCSALPRYSSAMEPAADFKSSAALRACCLLLSSLSRASAPTGAFCSALFSSAIGNLQLILAATIRVLHKLGKQIS